jgi:dihydroflavonol-4-reductase
MMAQRIVAQRSRPCKAFASRPLWEMPTSSYNQVRSRKTRGQVRILVLGGTRLVGNNIVRAALDAGWQVRTFERPRRRHPHHPALAGLNVEIASGDQEDSAALRRAMHGCDVVFHADRYSPPNSRHHQRRMAEARQHIAPVLEAAAGAEIGRLVYSSSAVTIGRSDFPSRLPDEWNVYRLGHVRHPYWDAQLVQEEAVLAFSRKSQVPVIVLNLAEAIGPHDYELEAAAPLIAMARRGIRQYMPGRTSVADARDIAQAHVAAATLGRPGERYILGGHNLTHRETVALMAHVCKRPPPDKPIDLGSFERLVSLSESISCLGRPNRRFPLAYQIAAARDYHWVDSGKARAELGYTLRPLINSYRATLSWLQECRLVK